MLCSGGADHEGVVGFVGEFVDVAVDVVDCIGRCVLIGHDGLRPCSNSSRLSMLLWMTMMVPDSVVSSVGMHQHSVPSS